MDLTGWDERYRAQEEATEPGAHPVVVEAASSLPPGRALDLACGTGRNALWLAEHGWSVTAVDGSSAAIDILSRRARRLGVTVDAQVVDLEKPGFAIEPGRYDLMVMCCYFQRELIEQCKRGLIPGGVMAAIALLIEPGKEHSAFRLQPGALRGYFADWEILHDREGADARQHKAAELIARRPAGTGL